MRTASTLSLAVAGLSLQVLGANFESKFLFPAEKEEGATFHFGDTLQVSWISNYTEPTLWLFCRRPNDNTPRAQWNERVAEFNGTQAIKLSFKGMAGCWLNLKGKDEKTSINSINWRYDNNERGQTTIGPTSTSAGPSQTSGSSASPTADLASTTTTPSPQAPNSSPSPSDSAETGLSTGVKAGIGAGAGLAGLAIIAAIIFLLVRRRRRADRGPTNDYDPVDPVEHNSVSNSSGDDRSKAELSAVGTPATQYQSVVAGDSKAWPSHFGQHPATTLSPVDTVYYSPSVDGSQSHYYNQLGHLGPQELYSGPMPTAHEMYVEPPRPKEMPSTENRT
ncbi:hypothetical protein Micbo1qcDRAFT_177492 [Microdochium bolleyi]|uniref:Mid2 domain-containing protein n=1 Tax=Microdochium bolleyi TaxID=196109 RepID=A0A136IVV3_9PEZI|nr:hypothetical protein Micbo1qcDRAFT_177492 [Microdochium bolleyi]